jgi:hypothetical protein
MNTMLILKFELKFELQIKLKHPNVIFRCSCQLSIERYFFQSVFIDVGSCWAAFNYAYANVCFRKYG